MKSKISVFIISILLLIAATSSNAVRVKCEVCVDEERCGIFGCTTREVCEEVDCKDVSLPPE